MNRRQILLFLLLSLTIAATLVNSRLFVYQTLTSYFLYSIFASTIILYTGSILLARNIAIRLNLSIPILLIILWGIYIALHGLLNGWNHRYFYLIICILFSFSFFQVISNQLLSVRWIYIIIIIAAFFEAIVCIAQFLGVIGSFNGYFRVTGTQVNPNITAMFLAMASGPVLALFRMEKRKSLFFWMYLISLAFIMLAIIMLKCRTAYLGAAVSIIIVFTVRYGLVRRLMDKRYRLITMILLILILGLTISFVSSIYHSKQASADGRKMIWKISMQMIAQKPLFGYGYGMFERNYNLHQAAYLERGKASPQETANASFVRMAYNETLENAVEGGVVGMFLFLGVIITLLIYGGKECANVSMNQSVNIKHRKYAEQPNLQYIMAFSGIAAFAVMSLVNFSVQAIPVMCIFMVYTGILTAKPDHIQEETKNSSSVFFKNYGLSKGFIRITGIILIILACWLVGTEVLYGIGQLQLKQAVKLSRSGNYLLAEKALDSLDTRLGKSDSYLYERGKVLMALKNYPLALDKLTNATAYTSNPDLYIDIGKCSEALKQAEEAKKAYQLAMNIAPTRFAPRYRLMELYLQNGDTANTLLTAHAILQLKPKIPSTEVVFYKKEAKDLILRLEGPKEQTIMKFKPNLFLQIYK